MALAIGAIGCSGDESPGRGGKGGKGDGGDDPFGNADSAFGNRDGSVGGPLGDGGQRPTGSGTSCGPRCFESGTGPGTDTPFDTTNNPSDHVGLDADGALVLQRDQCDAEELIWIANTREGTVSKVDTNAMVELGRYTIPGVDWSVQPSENGPSRTSVDGAGDVYAGARYGGGISKVSAKAENCPDTNGDGVITTSSGAGDVLPAGEDDCVIWTTVLGTDARGVAVQEIPSQFEFSMSPDGEPVITEIPGARYVWVGGQENPVRLFKLDAETGDVLLTLAPAVGNAAGIYDPVPAPTYGLALDGRGNLWISGRNQNSIGRIDTTRCVDDTCNAETVCVTVCTETSCPAACDGAVLERIELGHRTYGMTVDCAQRVWVGGAHEGGVANGVVRYDPLSPENARLVANRMVGGTDVTGIHGIAADASGWVWGAARDLGVFRVDAETLDFVQVAGTGGAEFSAKGMAVDRRGRVWVIPYRMDYAMVITPGATINDATVEKPIDGFVGPYTYSDMTGEQRRLAANEPGSYRQLFEGCPPSDKPTQWQDLSWDVDVPDGTVVVFLARTAENEQDLANAEWFEVAVAPGRVSPIEIQPFIDGAAQTAGRLIEIEVRLFTTKLGEESKDRCTSVPAITPRVKNFGVSYLCEPGLG